MKIVFFSGVEYGKHCIEKVVGAGWNVEAVFCLDGNHKNRSGFVDFSDLRERGIEVIETAGKTEDITLEKIKRIAPDIILVIGWSWIIPKEIIKTAKIAAIGHHPTLLPKHRGNAPIPWTLITGLARTGTSFFILEENIDSGDIVAQETIEVSREDNANSLYLKSMEASSKLLLKLLAQISEGEMKRRKQDLRKSSTWKKRKPEDGIIDWNQESICLHNWIRGQTHPYPGAFTFLGEEKIYVWKSGKYWDTERSECEPGEIIEMYDESIIVASGSGKIELMIMQKEGGKEMPAGKFAKENALERGMVLG